jgi:hypothetical protein
MRRLVLLAIANEPSPFDSEETSRTPSNSGVSRQLGNDRSYVLLDSIGARNATSM